MISSKHAMLQSNRDCINKFMIYVIIRKYLQLATIACCLKSSNICPECGSMPVGSRSFRAVVQEGVPISLGLEANLHMQHSIAQAVAPAAVSPLCFNSVSTFAEQW